MGIYKDVDIDMLNIVTTNGELGILPHHIPLATGIMVSEMNYLIDQKRYPFAISGGFLYVTSDNSVKIVANAIESPEEIDLNRAKEAEKRAKKRLASKDKSIDYARAELALKRALVRINIKS